MTDRRGADFADLVYTVLIAEKRVTIEDVAAELGMKYATLYARVHQRVPFSADEIRDLMRVVPDIRFANYFLDGSPYIAAERDTSSAPASETIHRGATSTVLEAADILRVVEEGLQDQKLDHRDKIEIMEEIQEAEQALAALRTRLTDA